MRALFALRSYRSLPQIRKSIEVLVQKGHTVLVVLYKNLTEETLEEISEYESSIPNLTFVWAPYVGRIRFWDRFVFHSRELLSYRKHLLFEGDHTGFYAERWRQYIHPWLKPLFGFGGAKILLKSWLAGQLLRFVESFTPSVSAVVRHLKEWKPGIVAVSPVNLRYSSADLEYLKAARALQIPTVLPMGSWDNITAKGLYHIWPDFFLLWNKTQVADLERHQGVPSSRTKVVGTPTLDHWFPPPPLTPRREFCKVHGMDPGRPVVSYFGGSSLMTHGDESLFAHELREVMDESKDPMLRNTQLLVRPHPVYAKYYAKVDTPGVFVVPRGEQDPDPRKFNQLFYDTLMHADVVVGVNTSAMLDAIILDRPVISVYSDRYKFTQADTHHFPEVVQAGAVYLKDISEVEKTLVDLLRGLDELKDKRHKFVLGHLRPRGLGKTAGETIAEEMEDLVRSKRDVT